ncbi:flavin prenyltransferase UbiX [Glaciecola petra]|uniref:Flavin prenyltransferase UbiX n=1 Tax=Glaciecola petra TaxID=3075602 RepID=A0ABU2ZTC7_9ALTE|nr:flavin prenyltransferase UbiX [Aestuariibacter sp. P117]MDT0595670.1 flavin prenyltransferase UbiX [Aestuariibacter sp. P117]
MNMNKEVTVAITGASGAPYALLLLKQLVSSGVKIHLLMSSAARVVFAAEENLKIPSSPEKISTFFAEYTGAKAEQIIAYGKEEWFSIVASGSSAPKTMIICPCSTGTLSSIAIGACDNLIERAADVVIKERGQLLLVPREMPFSSIHLENMLKLSNLGATIMPAAPGFYHNPKSIDDLISFVVARILDHLEIPQNIMKPWGYSNK